MPDLVEPQGDWPVDWRDQDIIQFNQIIQDLIEDDNVDPGANFAYFISLSNNLACEDYELDHAADDRQRRQGVKHAAERLLSESGTPS